MEKTRLTSKEYKNLHFMFFKVLKLKDLRKIKNRIKIIVVLANRKARFFILGVSISTTRGSIKLLGVCLDIA